MNARQRHKAEERARRVEERLRIKPSPLADVHDREAWDKAYREGPWFISGLANIFPTKTEAEQVCRILNEPKTYAQRDALIARLAGARPS